MDVIKDVLVPIRAKKKINVDSSGKTWHREETEDQNGDVGGYVGRRTAANGEENVTITAKTKQPKPPGKTKQNSQNEEKQQKEPKAKKKMKKYQALSEALPLPHFYELITKITILNERKSKRLRYAGYNSEGKPDRSNNK